MDERNPYEDLLDQLNQLLQLVQDCSNKAIDPGHVPLDIEKKISKLEQDVENFKKMGDDIVSMSGVSKMEVRKRIDGTADDISSENQDLIKKTSQLLSRTEALEQSYLTGSAPPPAEKKPEKELDDQQFRKRRRRKLKRFGGDEGWKPM